MKKCIALMLSIVIIISISSGTHAYSTSHPNTHSNTGNQANDIVAIAKTQIGYQETGENHTKYNVWYDGYDKGVVGWCAMFISWCANQAGIPDSIIAKTSMASDNAFKTPTYSFGNHTPKAGDIIYVDNMGDGNLDGISDHVGLIVDVDNSYIYTVE